MIVIHPFTVIRPGSRYAGMGSGTATAPPPSPWRFSARATVPAVPGRCVHRHDHNNRGSRGVTPLGRGLCLAHTDNCNIHPVQHHNRPCCQTTTHYMDIHRITAALMY